MTTIHVRRAADGFEIRGPAEHAAGVELPSVGGVTARWSVDADGLVARNDPLGFRPLFYRTDSDAITVGDDITELLRASQEPVELDVVMAGVVLEFGELLGERTLFTDVRTLPPGAVLRWDGGSAEIARSATAAGPDDPPSDRRAAIDRYIELFRAAVRRRLPHGDRVVLPLSGGEDSRHVLLELCHHDAPPDEIVTAATGRRDPDLRAARALTDHLGLAIGRCPHPIADLRLEEEANRRTSFCANELAWTIPLIDRLRSERATTYDGIGGDVLSAGLFLTPRRLELVRQRDWLGVIRDMTGGDGAARLRDLFVPAAVRRNIPPRGEIHALLARDLAAHAEEPNPIGSWMFATRTRRHMTMQPHALLGELAVHTPYLDVDLVRFLRSLPDHWLVDHRFHRDTIRRAHRSAAQIPFADELAGPITEVRQAARRRAEALRLMAQADIWSSPIAGRLGAIPRIRHRSFLTVRRAITVHQAAAVCRGVD